MVINIKEGHIKDKIKVYVCSMKSNSNSIYRGYTCSSDGGKG